MDRAYYPRLAAGGLRMPIGTDLVLHEQADPAAVLLDGRRLGEVVLETARRFRTPLALAHMNRWTLGVVRCASLSSPIAARHWWLNRLVAPPGRHPVERLVRYFLASSAAVHLT